MKSSVTKPTEFQPVTLTIVLETQKELDAYGALFNASMFTEMMRSCGASFPSFSLLLGAGAKVDVSPLIKALENTSYFERDYVKRQK